MTTATLRLGDNRYPVVLPSVRDPRLHLAAVIISIHVLGQTGLGFRVSVPQILVAILTCALIDVVWTFARTKQLVWPASALLTGSGVALIFRLVGADRGERWTWQGWELFAAVAALSLLSKYLVRHRGSHVFNPSNIGLVVAFLLLGSARTEPLDFWWAPLNGWMVAAYLIILTGGLLITARLGLLSMAAAFWATLALGLGVVAASGHCMTAAWSLAPVCGESFWWVIVTSPEILIFLFFMITDPKTIPARAPARIVFAVALGLLCALLIAPQTTEFGAKVALLGGLVLMTPLRSVFDRAFAGEAGLLDRLTAGPTRAASWVFARGAALGGGIVLAGTALVVAGMPARPSVAVPPAPVSEAMEVEVDPATLPPVTVAADLRSLNAELDTEELALALAQNLEIERRALLEGDRDLLPGADTGERLAEMARRIDQAVATGERSAVRYSFDSLALTVTYPDGPQGGARLELEARGTAEEITYDLSGVEKDRAAAPFRSTFVLREGSDRWLIAEVIPGAPG